MFVDGCRSYLNNPESRGRGNPRRSAAVGGAGSARAAESIRHRWQRDWNAQPLTRLQSRDIWRRIRLLGLLGLLVGLVGLLVFELWYRPVQTPLVAIVAPAYSWPLPPQAFAEEDIAALGNLDHVPDRIWERHGSIHLLRVSPAWHSTESGLADFDRQLHAAAQQSAASGTVILFVSMLGVVDSAGRPALIPPGASPLRSETWLPLADLLEHVKAQHLPDACHKLLVLDCNRVATDWSLGVLANGFADGLRSRAASRDSQSSRAEFGRTRAAGMGFGRLGRFDIRAFSPLGPGRGRRHDGRGRKWRPSRVAARTCPIPRPSR